MEAIERNRKPAFARFAKAEPRPPTPIRRLEFLAWPQLRRQIVNVEMSLHRSCRTLTQNLPPAMSRYQFSAENSQANNLWGHSLGNRIRCSAMRVSRGILRALGAAWRTLRGGRRSRPATSKSAAPEPELVSDIDQTWRIQYLDRDGNRTVRVISVRSINGRSSPRYVRAWCQTEQRERQFRLKRIEAVALVSARTNYDEVDAVIGWINRRNNRASIYPMTITERKTSGQHRQRSAR